MLANERQYLILEQLRRDGQVQVSALAEQFGVSDETIRRDINVLQKDGKLQRVHGGAVSIKKNLQEDVYSRREKINPTAKQKIGQYAASFVKDHEVILLGNGVTVDAVSPWIRGKDLTILTLSVRSLNVLMEEKQKQHFTGEIIFLGGIVDVENYCTYGPLVQKMLEQFSVDKAFISPTAVNEDGVHMYKPYDYAVFPQLLRRCSEIFILAEHDKLEKTAVYKACDLDEIHHLITEHSEELSTSFYAALQNAGVNLYSAGEGLSK